MATVRLTSKTYVSLERIQCAARIAAICKARHAINRRACHAELPLYIYIYIYVYYATSSIYIYIYIPARSAYISPYIRL